MCINHSVDVLKRWRIENQDKKAIVFYKVVWRDNTSLLYGYIWTVGKHQVVIQRLQGVQNIPLLSQQSGRGFYAYMDRDEAFKVKSRYTSDRCKVIAVSIEPRDVIYMGRDCDNHTVLVCRRLEIKSLRGLRNHYVD